MHKELKISAVTVKRMATPLKNAPVNAHLVMLMFAALIFAREGTNGSKGAWKISPVLTNFCQTGLSDI